MYLQQIFDQSLAQYAYLIGCQATGEAIVIDPERDIDRYIEAADAQNLTITAVAETHIHADFLSGARELADRLGCKLYLSKEGNEAGWASKWAENSDYKVEFIEGGDEIKVGNVTLKAVKTPGHTPEHLSYLVFDKGTKNPRGMISGDFLFVGDVGRPDLLETAAKQADTMKASAKTLFKSVKGVLDDQDNRSMIVWPAHGAGSSCGKGLGAVPHSTIGYETLENPALEKAKEGEEAFVEYILKDQPEPPLYFARMKTLNRDGVPLLGALPNPKELSVSELKKAVEENKLMPLDTRDYRKDFLQEHLPGSLYSPFSTNFSTTVGSLIEDSRTPILLIGSLHRKEELIRRLIRLGYDNIPAFVSFETLNNYFIKGGKTETIAPLKFEEAEKRRKEGAQVVDVRYMKEFSAGHLPGAKHAPYSRLPEFREKIPKDKPLIVHCHTGLRASVSSAYLKRQGFDVASIDDHFENYKKVGKLES